jgi:hypothetical protein
MNTERNTSFEEIIDEIMLWETKPNHDALTRWSKKYPEHREALAKFFATWAIQEKLPEGEAIDEARAGQRMLSLALNLLYKQNAARSAQVEPVKALELSEAAKARGLTEAEIANRCRLDESIVVKFLRRRINFESIPQKCFELFSLLFGNPLEQVRQMFMGSAIPIGVNKAQAKPVIKTEDFLDAVRSSDLSEEAKADWYRIVAEEKAAGGKR